MPATKPEDDSKCYKNNYALGKQHEQNGTTAKCCGNECRWRWATHEKAERKERKNKRNRILMGITRNIVIVIMSICSFRMIEQKMWKYAVLAKFVAKYLPMNRIMTAVLRAANWIIFFIFFIYFFFVPSLWLMMLLIVLVVLRWPHLCNMHS